MPIRDDLMIMAAFTYGLLKGELFRNLVGQHWNNAEELLRKVNRFLRQEDERAEKIRMEKRVRPPKRKERTPMLARTLGCDNPSGTKRYSRMVWLDTRRCHNRANPYRHETYDVRPQKYVKKDNSRKAQRRYI